MNKTYPFQLEALPYEYDALEPYMDALTVQIHHGRHVQTYVDNLNKVLEGSKDHQSWSLEALVTKVNELPDSIKNVVRNNGGGVYNHNLYFAGMTAEKSEPTGKLKDAIVKKFGSLDEFKANFKAAGLGRFGSGWAWLAVDANKELTVVSTPNQDTVLADGLSPILAMDVWEHAYYLKYQNKRADYIDNWFLVVDWNKANDLYTKAIG
ncbi:superoxide dismutase [Cellulosilyticum lentocellum]|uniref:Superoxide dismutase n=1 Tax=Cellulosilyticum lentocellum (strain ATCC 49066 / DSM 5427 / NCIMB 11756 / RHM5) TaxID=642492 RepID=F2JPL3_CELLD|nr:superoxide dismutase [Cellulosilyticum lentocellum]ADZ83673.1 Manganese/iron superoxide dismutase [Cellulosilyticum lentocellum DSM 5427]